MNDLFQVFERDFRIIHFASAKLDRDAHLMPLTEPAPRVVHFEIAMRSVRFRAQADFLDFNLGLSFFCFAFFLCFFVDEFPEIHYAANGRGCPRRNFHKIHFGVAGDLQSLTSRHNADIASIWTN